MTLSIMTFVLAAGLLGLISLAPSLAQGQPHRGVKLNDSACAFVFHSADQVPALRLGSTPDIALGILDKNKIFPIQNPIINDQPYGISPIQVTNQPIINDEPTNEEPMNGDWYRNAGADVFGPNSSLITSSRQFAPGAIRISRESANRILNHSMARVAAFNQFLVRLARGQSLEQITNNPYLQRSIENLANGNASIHELLNMTAEQRLRIFNGMPIIIDYEYMLGLNDQGNLSFAFVDSQAMQDRDEGEIQTRIRMNARALAKANIPWSSRYHNTLNLPEYETSTWNVSKVLVNATMDRLVMGYLLPRLATELLVVPGQEEGLSASRWAIRQDHSTAFSSDYVPYRPNLAQDPEFIAKIRFPYAVFPGSNPSAKFDPQLVTHEKITNSTIDENYMNEHPGEFVLQPYVKPMVARIGRQLGSVHIRVLIQMTDSSVQTWIHGGQNTAPVNMVAEIHTQAGNLLAPIIIE